MKYLPLEDITYKSNLDSKETLSRLSENIEPKQTFRMIAFSGSNHNKPYVGAIDGNTALSNNEDFEPMALIPFGMLIFGYAMVTGGFKYESINLSPKSLPFTPLFTNPFAY